MSLLFLLSGAGFVPGNAQSAYQPSKSNLEARRWFQDAKFGLFVHWGVYSVLGDGEWVMNNKRIQISDYEKLPAQFNPTAFDAAEWVSMVKSAGMKYITITSKHHDGFAMFDSKVSDWDIVDRTPYKKDVLKLLADECRKQGIKLFFYHSQLDWHHTDYFPRGRTGQDAGRPNQGEWNKYLDYMDAQLTELLTNYGEVAGIWFDGWWDKPEAEWRLERTYKLIHDLQPAALVGANHHRKPFSGEDFQMFEKDLPGRNTAGFNKDSVIGDLPLETCETMNNSWGFNITDRRYKSTRELIQYLVRASGYGANFLLNVGPMPNGKIQPEFVAHLKEVGQWLGKNGEAIYDTRGGPVTPRSWGVTTKKDNKVYVHILDWPSDDMLWVPVGSSVKSAKYLKTGGPAAFVPIDKGVLLKTIPRDAVDEYDTIVVLELDN
ncbi:MAG TPA: alpha-L-fucosidase [Blastocatellia bacterium]|jgi:alpha-L-fucosidase|nr:alpha-L-fucosidase [Blastocatellia bacterium]